MLPEAGDLVGGGKKAVGGKEWRACWYTAEAQRSWTEAV